MSKLDVHPVLVQLSKIYAMECNQPDYIVRRAKGPYDTWEIIKGKDKIGTGRSVPYDSFIKEADETKRTNMYYMAQRANLCGEMKLLMHALVLTGRQLYYKDQLIKRFLIVTAMGPTDKNPILVSQGKERTTLREQECTHEWAVLISDEGAVHIDLTADQYGVHNHIECEDAPAGVIPFYAETKAPISSRILMNTDLIGRSYESVRESLREGEKLFRQCPSTTAYKTAKVYLSLLKDIVEEDVMGKMKDALSAALGDSYTVSIVNEYMPL